MHNTVAGSTDNYTDSNTENNAGLLTVVPTPVKQFVRLNGEREPIYDKYNPVLHVEAEEFMTAAEIAAQYMRKAGFEIQPVPHTPDTPAHTKARNYGGKNIKLVFDPGIEAHAYSINTMGTWAVISASDIYGANYSLATLLQIMRAPARETDSDNAGNAAHILLPECDIEDAPECSYRGMMVDLARSWHEPEYLFKYADMCWYYKISVLHLHFTDDQSYTLPSRILPKISTKERSYTFETIHELGEYAHGRGVSIMPEIDVPGHCTSFQTEYPEIFGTDGIICQNAESVEIMRRLFRELCDMFPHSDKIHIGGDEASILNWLKCDRCGEYAREIGIDINAEHAEHLLYVNFICKMAETVTENGKIPVVWEGFPESTNELVPKNIIVMSWENYYQITPSLLNAGFTIINCSWNPLYIVTPEPAWPVNDISKWSVYKWMPVHSGSPLAGVGYTAKPTEQIIGGQLLAWGDRIPGGYKTHKDGVEAELALLKERLPYLAENTWNRERRLPFEILGSHVRHTNALLENII